MQVPTWNWILFGALLLVFLALDLWSHRGERHDSRRTALLWSGVWITVGLSFGAFVWWQHGGRAAGHYLGAYLIEESLSMDNLFVFLIVFKMLRVPKDNQRVALSWGIFGALFLRGIFIFAGAAALDRFHWVVFVFGGLLLVAAWRTFVENPTEESENRVVKWLSNHLPVTHEMHGDHFIALERGRRVATPLLIAVIGLELTDVLFAIDSVPAAFAITREPFIVYTSNAFAILGLRSLYIVLAKTLPQMAYLHYGLSLVLAFAAIKLMIGEWIEIPVWISIAFIVVVLGVSILWSVRHGRRSAGPTGRSAASERSGSGRGPYDRVK
jgi:TerC family integral membrane protein